MRRLHKILQFEESSKSTDDSERLQENMGIEVSHKVLPDDQGLSIDTAHEEKNPIHFSYRFNGRK